MTKEFKVGDKVCHIGFGKGIVTNRDGGFDNAICVEFSGRLEYFTIYGKVCKLDKSPSLYHGHGTFQFIPKPEPEYTWQWLFFSKFDEEYYTSRRFKSEPEFIKATGYTPEWYQRVEESKREACQRSNQD